MGREYGQSFSSEEMGSGSVVIVQVRCKDVAQMALVEDDDLIQALPPNRAAHAFDVSVLPRRAWCRDDLSDSHRRYPLAEDRSVRGIAVAQQKRGAVSHGNASITCCESHAAVGCSVTSNRTTFLRP
jgi:hypothetical protein